MKGFVDLCWFTIKWGLLLAAAAALAIAPFLYDRLDEEIRARAEQHLASQFPHLTVSVRSAQLIKGEGIIVRGISLRNPAVEGPLSELSAVDEVFVACNTDLTDFVSGDLTARHVIVRRPRVRLWRGADGQWNAAHLVPRDRSKTIPSITIENGTYELYDLARPDVPALRLREAQFSVNATIEQPLATGGRAPLRVQGTCATDFLRHAKVDALVDPDGLAWRAGGGFDAFEVNPQDWQSLPGAALPVPELLRSFRGTGHGEWSVDYVAARQPPLEFKVTGQVSDGRVDDARLVYPVTELRADFTCDQHGARISNLAARHGQAALRCEVECQGYTPASPVRLAAQAHNLQLDQKLLQVFPAKWQSEWHKYMPVGEVDVDARMEFDGATWKPRINIQCGNVSFTHYKFPYRLDRGRGAIEIDGPRINCTLTAHSENSEVRITAQVEGDTSPPQGWVEVRGDGVRIDEKLIFAMPEKAADVVRSLHPAGSANIFYRWWNEAREGPEPHQFAQIGLNRCSVRLEKFPYPIDEVTGIVELRDQSWLFRDLRGTNDRGWIACSGQSVPGPNGRELVLHAVATNIALEDELREALAPGVQQMWQALRPRGMVNLTVDLSHRTSEPGVRVWARAEPVENTLSIEPVQLPYRLENARGVFVFSDGRVTIDGFKAQHGRATLTARGTGDLLPTGGWTLHLDHFHWDRLIADREFVTALPGRLKKLVSDLDIRGPISLQGALDLTSGGPSDLPRSEWDMHVDFQQAVLNCGVRLDNVNGGVNLTGNFDGREVRCRGEIAIDSLVFRDHQITDIRGPLWIDDSRLLLGYWADRVREAKPERRLSARLYGGSVVADGWVNLGNDPRYEFNATLSGGDLTSWARISAPGQTKLSGEVMANVELRGRSVNANDMTGRGSIQLRNANIYELPLMVSLLKLFSTVPPDSTAFTTSDIDFRIQGEHLYVDRMELNGDAISLLGKGEVGMNRQINLAFYAVVGRDETRTAMMRTLLGGASQQIMQIHAEGTLDQPIVRREAFPAVNQALQQLQADFQAREAMRKQRQAARGGGLNMLR